MIIENYPDCAWTAIPNTSYDACIFTGQVRNRRTGHILRPSLRSGYPSVCIHGRRRDVHRLVMSAHLGRQLERHEVVRHLNGVPVHNAADNLALGTARDNSADRLRHGTSGTKLRPADVYLIRWLGSRQPAATIAKRAGVSTAHVRQILAGRRWAALV